MAIFRTTLIRMILIVMLGMGTVQVPAHPTGMPQGWQVDSINVRDNVAPSPPTLVRRVETISDEAVRKYNWARITAGTIKKYVQNPTDLTLLRAIAHYKGQLDGGFQPPNAAVMHDRLVGNLEIWTEWIGYFGSMISANGPYKSVYEMLKEEFERRRENGDDPPLFPDTLSPTHHATQH